MLVVFFCYIYVGGSFLCNYAGDCFWLQLCMHLEVSAANIWVTIFMEIMQVGVSVAIMQVVFSTMHYAHDY